MQRLGYYKARYLAVRDKRVDEKEGHVTIIMDGMDQNTTMLPWYPKVRICRYISVDTHMC